MARWQCNAVASAVGLVLLAGGLQPAAAQVGPQPIPEVFSGSRGEARFPNNVLFRGRRFPAEISFGRESILNRPVDERQTSVLSDQQQQQIRDSHLLAWRQVNLALQYLGANSRQILDGQDELYSDTFGRFYDRSVSNPLLGDDFVDRPAVTVRRDDPIGIVMDLDEGGQNGGQQQQQMQEGFQLEFEDESQLPRTLKVGDLVVIGNEEIGHEVHEVIGIETGDEGGGNQDQNGNQQNQEMETATGPDRGQFIESLTLATQPFADLDEDEDVGEVEVNEVLGEDVEVVAGELETGRTLPNRDHLNRVVETFEAIRDMLESDTTYIADPDVILGLMMEEMQGTGGGNGAAGMMAVSPFDRVFAVGNDPFQFDRAAFDRAFRQFGFSNSLSDDHLSQLLNDPDNPLLWVDEGGATAMGTGTGAGTGMGMGTGTGMGTGMATATAGTGPLMNGEDREFFLRRHMTAFAQGGLLGTGVLPDEDGNIDEDELTARLMQQGFTDVEIDAVLEQIEQIQELTNNNNQMNNQMPNFGPLLSNRVFLGGGFLSELQRSKGDLFETQPIDNLKPTDLLQFQMLVSAFAEAGPEVMGMMGEEGGTGFGIAEIMDALGSPNGDRDLPFPQNRDAGRFGSFADVLTDPRVGDGIGDGEQLPPEGKSGVALSPDFEFIRVDNTFAPVVPTQ